MTNAPRHVRSIVASLGPPVIVSPGERSVAALGRFWYPKPSFWPVAVSATLHLAVTAALVWTVGDVLDRPVSYTQSVSFIPPPQRSASATHDGGDGMLAMVSLSYISGPGISEGTAGQTDRTSRRVGELNSGRNERAARTEADTGALSDNVYTSFEVDNAVEVSYGSAVPQYPPDLLARRVQGRVIVRFVVDTSGSADVESLEILNSSDPQFAASVRAAIPHMRFSPARLNGRRVRQLVEQPFRFNVDVPASNPTDSAAHSLG